ncbi:mitochondrial carrier [Morchella conica CCBAS932]|uniref:Mitochondrial thiamine pyrophosphate carrier 1 n=2 Tax=Morchella sect. Distantes TaxID=1051054 RepID=A0A3N4L190_9PEZI|nr:mitochondrial carrier [Morchella conica CCBAS932]
MTTPGLIPPPKETWVALRSYVGQPVTASFIAGGVAGAVSRTVVSPLERLKILFQVQGPGNQSYQGVGPALMKMWREEGWRGFMRGNGTNCIRIVPYSAVQFSSYGIYKKLLLPEGSNDLGTFRRLTAGAMAGITSVVATYPLDIVRTRLSIQSASFASLGRPDTKLPGMFATMKLMYRAEGGMVSLYRGLGPTLAGVAPYVGINFATYEAMRKFMTPEGEQNPSALGKLAAGAISGAVAQSVTYPFDVLRRRFQVNTMSGIGYQYKGLWDAITIIVKAEGPKGLYKGLLPNLLKVAPSIGSSFLSFEIARDLLLGFGGTL